MNGFCKLSVITSSIAFVLFFSLLILPEPIFLLFGIEGNESAYIIARRTAMLFLGLSLLSFLNRNAEDSPERQSLILSLFVIMFGLVILGLIELFRGEVGPGILLAVVTELMLSIWYMSIWYENRSQLGSEKMNDVSPFLNENNKRER